MFAVITLGKPIGAPYKRLNGAQNALLVGAAGLACYAPLSTDRRYVFSNEHGKNKRLVGTTTAKSERRRHAVSECATTLPSDLLNPVTKLVALWCPY